MVDYDIISKKNSLKIEHSSFKIFVSDWGSAGNNKMHFGGTPLYASAKTFEESDFKDLFSFCNLAMELYLDRSGKDLIEKGESKLISSISFKSGLAFDLFR